MANRDDNRIRVGYGLGEDGNAYPYRVDPVTGRLLITIASPLSGTATATEQPLKRDDNFIAVGGTRVVGVTAGAANTGAKSPRTMADDTTVGTEVWLFPNSAKVSDGTYSTALLYGFLVSHYLKATNFGFSIPTGATIDGILVEIEEKYQGEPSLENTVKIVKSDGTIGTENKSTGATLPTSDTYVSYGSSSNLWSETWTAEDINDVDFGVVFSAVAGAGVDISQALIDHIRITVYYTAVEIEERVLPWHTDANTGHLATDLLIE